MNKIVTQLIIDKERYRLEKLLEKGYITERDIIQLMNQDINYCITFSDRNYTEKELYLKNLYRRPYLLCDQNVSENIKILLIIKKSSATKE